RLWQQCRPGAGRRQEHADVFAAGQVIDSLRAPARTRRQTGSYWRLRSLAGMGYAAPLTVMVIVFFVVPLALVFWMSFNDWKILGSPTFNCPQNYKDAVDDDLLKTAIGFTLKYTAITTVVLSAVAMGLALLVQEARPGAGLLRTLYLLPAAVGFAAS